MKKHVAAVRLVDRDEATEAAEVPEELRLPLGAIAGVAREGLLAMCTTVTGDEIELATYAAFSNDDLLSQVVMERMLAGWRPAGTLG